MRIVYVSTYPPIECGIGTYTQFLSNAVSQNEQEVHIVSQYGASGKNVHPVYSINTPGFSKNIFDMTVKITPDLVHIQHEFGLFGDNDGIGVLDLIYRYKSTCTPVVATFHTVDAEPSHVRHLIISTMCRELDSIIVHEDSHVERLVNSYGADKSKLHLIPHGTRDIPLVPQAKEKLCFTGKKIILLAGYFRPNKGFERIVDLFPRIVKNIPEAVLVISGKMRILEYGTYRHMLLKKINNSPVKNKIEVLRGQFPQKTFDTILSASDVIVLPYSKGAQSGVMAHAMTFGKPVVTSDIPAFRNIIEKTDIGYYAQTDDEYVEFISQLLLDQHRYNECSNNALNYVKNSISWKIIADQTLEIYESVNPMLECPTRYVYFG